MLFVKVFLNDFKVVILKLFSKDFDIDLTARILFETELEGRNKIMKNTILQNCKLGYATYVGSSSTLLNSDIGRYCSIGSNVKVIAGNHPTKKFVSTHPLFYSSQPIAGLSFGIDNNFEQYSYADKDRQKWCVIGNDVWIGSNVLLLNGITIGDGAIIAAGAVVTKDVQPYSISGGIPAKHIKFRFNNEEIDYLRNLKWWNKDQRWIEQNAKNFSDINELISVIHI